MGIFSTKKLHVKEKVIQQIKFLIMSESLCKLFFIVDKVSRRVLKTALLKRGMD